MDSDSSPSIEVAVGNGAWRTTVTDLETTVEAAARAALLDWSAGALCEGGLLHIAYDALPGAAPLTMLRDIARRMQMSLDDVPFVGDSWSDIQAARAAGACPVLVRSGKGRRTESAGHDLTGGPVYDDLAAFVSDWLR